jgi:hypothetical protein
MAEALEEALKRLRIVLFGLMGGLAAFGTIALGLGPLSKVHDATFTAVLLGVLGLLCVADAVGYRFLRGQVVQGLRARTSELRAASAPLEKVLPEYQRLFIVRAGLTEGPGFFALIAYLVTGSPVALLVAAGALLLLFNQMPSKEGVEALLEAALSSE